VSSSVDSRTSGSIGVGRGYLGTEVLQHDIMHVGDDCTNGFEGDSKSVDGFVEIFSLCFDRGSLGRKGLLDVIEGGLVTLVSFGQCQEVAFICTEYGFTMIGAHPGKHSGYIAGDIVDPR
jgi:hypothetical protein